MVIDVLHVSKLANLKLKESEVKTFTEQLSSILDYIEKLKEVKTEGVLETSQITGLVNITRDDKPLPSLNQEETVANSKEIHNGFFEVEAILDQ
jgi:aspartyl-tRNA(Asn)/glutamyl-tRNA(Gln) amidotransferase subunit C